MSKHITATLEQQIACYNRLREVLNITDQHHRLCAYIEPHTDLSISNELGIGLNSLKGVRLKMFGKLNLHHSAKAPDPDSDGVWRDQIHDQLQELQDNVRMLEVAITELQQAKGKLL